VTARNAYLVFFSIWLTNCSKEPTVLFLHLQPDPTRQNEAAVASTLARIVVAIDLPTPGQELAGLPAGPGSNTVHYLDLDGDGAREIVFNVPWNKRDSLPVIEVQSEQNRGRAVLLRADGYNSAGDLVAIGSLEAVELGLSEDASVPFNLLPSALPLRVVMTQPEGGQLLLELKEFGVTFSRLVRPDTVTPNTMYLDCPARGGGTTAWRPSEIEVTEQRFQSPSLGRTHVRARLGDAPPVTECAVVVTTDVRADDGTALDQDATLPGADPFRGETFLIAATLGPPECDPDVCPAAAGLRCDDTLTGCVILNTCVTCHADWLCDPRTGQCEFDCRAYGVCPDPTQSCDTSSGLCSPR
jgi:hypothetical protein